MRLLVAFMNAVRNLAASIFRDAHYRPLIALVLTDRSTRFGTLLHPLTVHRWIHRSTLFAQFQEPILADRSSLLPVRKMTHNGLSTHYPFRRDHCKTFPLDDQGACRSLLLDYQWPCRSLPVDDQGACRPLPLDDQGGINGGLDRDPRGWKWESGPNSCVSPLHRPSGWTFRPVNGRLSPE